MFENIDMKKYILLLLAIFITVFTYAQPQVFTLEHNGNTTVHNHLDSALNKAQTGDIIYLPGGMINFSGNINKSVSIIGAGFHPDSTIATGQSILKGASQSNTTVEIKNTNNVMITGVFFSQRIQISSSNNVLLSRCRLGTTADDQCSISSSSNINISSCIVNELVIGSSGVTNALLSNCLIYGSRMNANSANYDHSIFFRTSQVGQSSELFTYPSSGWNISNSVFTNCIILNATVSTVKITSNSRGNIFYNCVFSDTAYVSTGTGIIQNCVFNKPMNTILQNVSNIVNYNSNDNFHLTATSPAKGAGQSGTDCGIYGGSNPFKEGGVPLNPHIQAVNIAPNTDQNGNLNINIKVKAQKR